jgi:hypothetical protein
MATTMRTRTRYLPLIEAEAGMVLGSPVHISQHGQLRYSLPAGHTLTSDNIHQLAAHRAEFLYIAEADTRSDEQVAIDAAHAAKRVMEIFTGADLGDPTMATLFDQVLAYRSA